MEKYIFDFNFMHSYIPIVTISVTGIAFNRGASNALGNPEFVDIGYDMELNVIGIRKHQEGSKAKPYEFDAREKDGWIRINAKRFARYAEQKTDIKFSEKARQFIPTYDRELKMLIVKIDKEHIQRKQEADRD